MLNLAFHDVAKIEITGTDRIPSSQHGEFNTRELTVTFDDGTTQRVEFYNHNESLPLEIN